MEGVEPSWPLDRRLLRPVRIPVPPHPQVNEPPAHACRAGGSLGSCSRPRLRPLGSCRLEARLAADLQLDDLGGARHRLGPSRDPDEVEMHLRLLSVSKGARGALRCQRAPRAKSEMSCGVAVSKPTTSSIPGSFGAAIEKPFETMPTTTSRASMPEAWR
jgi:hypothetical protein